MKLSASAALAAFAPVPALFKKSGMVSRSALALAPALLALLALLAGCSLGQGEGRVHSDDLYAKDCILPTRDENGALVSCPGPDGVDEGCDAYDLRPDFFAAVPYRETIQMRVQRGTDITELSDGLATLVNDVDKIRKVLGDKQQAAIDAGATEEEAAMEYVELPVALPAGVQPPGAPIAPPAPCNAATQLCDAQPVAISLYLQKSCHNQNTVLYAVTGWVRFRALFSADPNETSAADKYTDAEFDVVIGDPRDAPPGVAIDATAIPEELTSRLTGFFRFYFERGKPGQPFPG